MKISFIGAGSMGGAIIRRLSRSPHNIYVSRRDQEALKLLAAEYGIFPCSNAEAAKNDILFMAVKPNMFTVIIDEIRESVRERKPLIVSMAAGLTTDSIEQMFGFDIGIVRIMPNVNAEIGRSVTSICRNKNVTDPQLEAVKEIMEYSGSVIDVNEDQFSIFSAIAGCSPAYVYAFIDALARGAQKMGMNKSLAIKITASAVEGSSAMLAQSGKHPQELVDKVCSPGGTTIEGLCTLEEYGFTAGIVKAVENIVNKDKRLNK